MNLREKHDVGNTAQGLKYVCRKLARTRTKHADSAKEITELISDIEFYAHRLERCMKGRAGDKYMTTFDRFSDLELLTMLLIGEAEGEPWESKVGVALTVRNRVKAVRKAFGRGWHGVMLHPHQFSCFTSKSAIKRMFHHRRKKTPVWQECWKIALATYLDLISDFVGGPLYYHSTSISKPASWKGVRKLDTIGNHVFYTDACP